MHKAFLILLLGTLLVLPGCGTYDRQGLSPTRVFRIEDDYGLKAYAVSPEIEDRILAMDPENVTEKDIRETLSKAPAPQVIIIHGGIYSQIERLTSFGHFLVGMGYPEASIRNPGDGTWSFSCYESADKIAGMIAWYYEEEGMRPMLVGHSQGGMQNIKILDIFAHSDRVEVWSPLTWKGERRYEITDPLTGKKRPAAGLVLPYVASSNAGGMTRLLPNQWEMNFSLRTIPDSVEEFTGFFKGLDPLGGDLLGYGSTNLFNASGTAHVRNVQLPTGWAHGAIPDTEHLLKSRAIIDRINAYRPPPEPDIVIEQNKDTMAPETLYMPWAEDVWFSIKKHWVLELQRLIRARRAMRHA